MLVELQVENYAVVERLRVRFHPGLNVLTGETGSGKSIVVDSLGLLFGNRAASEAIRTGAERARVAGIFEVSSAAAKILESAGIEPEDGELLIEREIQSNGKSRVYVGSRPATAALLRDLAPFLGDIHGQHDQQQLFSPTMQREMLDNFGVARDTVDQASAAYRAWTKAATELDQLNKTEQERLRLADLWSFQRKEIEDVGPRLGEDEELEAERLVLRNVVRLQDAAQGAYELLHEGHPSASEQLRMAEKRMEEIARIDPQAGEIAAQIRQALIDADEATATLRAYIGKLEADPARLNEVEARMAALEKVKRKYGATTGEILAFLETVKADLSAIEFSAARREELTSLTRSLEKECRDVFRKLSGLRMQAAKQLAKRVETELGSLAMDKTRIEIRVEETTWTESGADRVEFLIAPNVGEELKPLDKIASGGELSRVALALRTAVAPSKPNKETQRTLVFDEVDAGVGGSAAESVGRRLKKLAGSAQVLCVTHLAQVASFADHHFVVEKHTAKGRTVTTVEELDESSRARELARMFSGETLTQEAIRHAERMLKAV